MTSLNTASRASSHFTMTSSTLRSDVPEADITLRDGRAVHLRAVTPADEAEFLQAFERVDDAARYMRFMRAVRAPNVERLRKALASFPENGNGIVATVPATDGFDIVGSAVCMLGEGNTCEFAITVTPQYGGTGLGTVLMNALISAASSRGLAEMHGYVLAINQSMLRLARRLGFSIAPDPDDPAIRICRLPLGAAR